MTSHETVSIYRIDMSLSHYYSDIDLYLTDVLQFLKEFQWIYTTSNTEFIVHGTLRKIPAEWIPTIDSLSLDELNEIPFDYVKVPNGENNCEISLSLLNFLFVGILAAWLSKISNDTEKAKATNDRHRPNLYKPNQQR